jgi:hypothetical protein
MPSPLRGRNEPGIATWDRHLGSSPGIACLIGSGTPCGPVVRDLEARGPALRAPAASRSAAGRRRRRRCVVCNAARCCDLARETRGPVGRERVTPRACRAQKPRIGAVNRSFFEFARPAPPRRPRWRSRLSTGRDTCFVNIVWPHRPPSLASRSQEGSIRHHGNSLRVPDQPDGARGKPLVRLRSEYVHPSALFEVFVP